VISFATVHLYLHKINVKAIYVCRTVETIWEMYFKLEYEGLEEDAMSVFL